MNWIFEYRFLFEEGAYRVYVTDEKRNMDQKDIHYKVNNRAVSSDISSPGVASPLSPPFPLKS